MTVSNKITQAVRGVSDEVRKRIANVIQGEIHSKYQSLPAIPIADIDGIRYTLKRLSVTRSRSQASET